jgi:hypothetical protein
MSCPEVFCALESVAFWLASRHREVHGEFEETWREEVVEARWRTARRKLMKVKVMMSF